MTAKAALCMALLEGRVLNVGNCFREIGLTNISRELPRMVERPFGVEVSRTPRAGKNRYGSPSSYVDYRLNHSEHNIPGIQLMKKYVEDNGGKITSRNPVGRPRNIQTPTPIEEKLF